MSTDAEVELPPAHSEPPARPLKVVRPAVLFLLTLVSVFIAGMQQEGVPDGDFSLATLLRGWTFAVPLMAILVTHELGHFVAARIHRVPASLPHFIPMPLVSPFGTMGAVIGMTARIRSRNALLDIGAAGPLAGMIVAIPVLIIGLAQSEVRVVEGHGLMEGQCLLYLLVKRLVLGPIPEGSDVFLTPTAFAGWAGLLVTSLNLIPIGQLDGGHVAYALLGPRHDKAARLLLWALPLAFLYNVLVFWEVYRAQLLGVAETPFDAPGLVWLIWFGLLMLMTRISGNHPPTEPGELSPVRRAVAVGCLILFVLLFMPTPLRWY